MIHQVRKAVDTSLPLRQTLAHWHKIRMNLAEPPRERRPREMPLKNDVIETS